MMVTLADSVGTTRGGEFLATVAGTGPIGIYGPGVTFGTFCVETDEYIYFGTPYYVTLSDSAVEGGSGGPEPDPLSPQSAYLYSLWLDGTDGVNTIVHSSITANALQRAIWFIEGELWGVENDFVDLANVAVAEGGVWFDTWGYTIGDIRVMNLWGDADHTVNQQDMLVRVPVPAAVLLGMLGMAVAGWIFFNVFFP
jgi:hypothetical protein